MAQQIYRLALQNADFPMLRAHAGRTVIVPNQDAALQDNQSIPRYKPKLIYAHNVLPTSEGLRSVGYLQAVAAAVIPATDFDEVWDIADAAGNQGLFSPAGGKNYFAPSATLVWASTSPMAANSTTRGKWAGQTFICRKLEAIYEIDCLTGAMTALVVAGIVPATDIWGITSANNYLIAWNKDTIFWCNPENPADWVPSLITGAGSEIPTELRGEIVACYPALNGFYVYTTENIILATYSGNTQYTWIYKDIAGALAIVDAENVTHAAVDLYNVAMTIGGLIRFSSQGAETFYPEVSDFLSGEHYEDFNSGTATFTDTPALGIKLPNRVTRIGTRYLAISYGNVAGAFTHALIYDFAVKRWGKLKIAHVYCFPLPSFAGAEQLEQISFLAANGTISKVSSAYATAATDAVVIIGGISVTRGTTLTLHEVDVDAGAGAIVVKDLPSFDGKTYQPAVTLVVGADGNYPARISALQHNIVISGSFQLTSMQATTVQFGVR